jgi:diguanylate cyclase (GGDEF)-like protein
VKLASRYVLFGMLVGLVAPAGLLIYGLVGRGGFDPVWFSALLAGGGMIVFAIAGSMIGRRDELLLRRNSELAALSDTLAALSTTDALTGLDNRRSFDDRLAMEITRVARYDVPCALVMIDLDRFKAVNDRYGHQAGDDVLRHVAALLTAEKRSGDMIARYGGEELAAILPHTSAAAAAAWAERARARFEGEPTSWREAAIAVTASFGIASAPAHATSATALIEGADRALYLAKQRGGNAVVVANGTRHPDWRLVKSAS